MYRTQSGWTLVQFVAARIYLLSCLLAGPFSISALAADDDWPAPIDYPPTQLAAPRPAAPPPAEKKSGRLFGIFPRKKKIDPASVNTVGSPLSESKPQEPLPSPFPLLRLSMPIETGAGVLPAGIYLAAPAPKGEGEGNDPKQRALLLMQRNEPVLRISFTQYEGPSDNEIINGTPSPLQKTTAGKEALPLRHLEVRLKPDGKSMIFVWEEDDVRFDSPPYPVISDPRPNLKF
jgi:hypothetical protein